MADIVPAEVRSRMMAGIGSKDTKPELMIRQGLHARGFRFRLGGSYRKGGKLLPGRPDLVFPGQRAVIFVHGCFWHGHDCALYRLPQTRQEFWQAKIARNRERDAEVEAKLRSDGWRVLSIWECCIKGRGKLGIEQVLALADEWIRSHQDNRSIRGL